MEITLKELKAKKACQSHLDLFQKHFGESVELTREILIAAPAQGFALNWFAENFLSEEQGAMYWRAANQAWTKYRRVMAQAWAKYRRVEAPAWTKYLRVMTQARAEHERVMAQAWAEHERAQESAQEEYEQARAAALADILKLD